MGPFGVGLGAVGLGGVGLGGVGLVGVGVLGGVGLVPRFGVGRDGVGCDVLGRVGFGGGVGGELGCVGVAWVVTSAVSLVVVKGPASIGIFSLWWLGLLGGRVATRTSGSGFVVSVDFDLLFSRRLDSISASFGRLVSFRVLVSDLVLTMVRFTLASTVWIRAWTLLLLLISRITRCSIWCSGRCRWMWFLLFGVPFICSALFVSPVRLQITGRFSFELWLFPAAKNGLIVWVSVLGEKLGLSLAIDSLS